MAVLHGDHYRLVKLQYVARYHGGLLAVCTIILVSCLLSCTLRKCCCYPIHPATCEEAQKHASEEESEEGEGVHQEEEEGDTVVPRRTTNGSKSAQLIRRLNADKPRVKKATKLNHSKKYHCTYAKAIRKQLSKCL